MPFNPPWNMRHHHREAPRIIYRDPYAIITTETLDKLAKALGVPSSELIEDVPDK
jgi:hypothetical protein